MKRFRAFNERLAVRGTDTFGSMWTTYGFMLYGFLPVVFPALMATLLYWSNTVQLWSLPLIMVGQNVGSRTINSLIRQMHDAVMEELSMVREELQIAREQRDQMADLLGAVHGSVVERPST